jgi:hypothetical protein
MIQQRKPISRVYQSSKMIQQEFRAANIGRFQPTWINPLQKKCSNYGTENIEPEYFFWVASRGRNLTLPHKRCTIAT